MKVVLTLLIEVIFAAAVMTGVILGLHTHKKRSLVLGVICDVFNIIMYGMPLSIMKKVVTTKSVEYMPFFLSLTGFLNGCIWTSYALIKFDIYLLISNGLGAILGAVQLVLYACYYKSTPTNVVAAADAKKPNRPKIQLSGSDNV
ncbi:hypothetical protein CRG98_024508 [Punica granatum]|nr:hypothetical protein CRG98_024508 [Punica granatum]